MRRNLKPPREALLSGDANTAKAGTEQSLAAGTGPLRLVQESMIPAMKTTVEGGQPAGSRPPVKILVGGAPVTSKFADGNSQSAAGAFVAARKAGCA